MSNLIPRNWKMALSSILLLAIVGGLFAIVADANAYVSVRGYYKSNGTYVRSYVRSSPNALRYDNYGYRGGSLYNPSYYSSSRNYSSSWYATSYLTDPDYNLGKSLYQNRSSSWNY